MNNDEIQNAIEFLLKNQDNFEVQLEKTNRQIAQTDQQIAQTDRQIEQTNRQLEQTNQRVSLLAETQTEFIQAMLSHVETQRELNADMRQTMRELAQTQQRTQQDISDLTKIVGGVAMTVYGDGNLPLE
ncbi:MAG TPA: hypothetical protein VM095_18640 [Pyrinomonadaceae bacterium]|nr:hypothetical protein [Pyrinomonadaceae bacterium]